MLDSPMSQKDKEIAVKAIGTALELTEKQQHKFDASVLPPVEV